MSLIEVICKTVDELFLNCVPGVAVFEEDGKVVEAQRGSAGQVGFDLQIAILNEAGIMLAELLHDRGWGFFGRYRGEFDYVFVHGGFGLKIEGTPGVILPGCAIPSQPSQPGS